MTHTDIDRLRRAVERCPLPDDHNVLGVGHGHKRVDGSPTDQLSVTVLVSEKHAPCDLDDDRLVDPSIEVDGVSIPTDVQAIGRPHTLPVDPDNEVPTIMPAPDRLGRHRPVPGGVSGGHPSITAGTIGSPLLYHEPSSEFVVLTNAHIAAPLGDGEAGDDFLQPGPHDGGTAADVIGTVLDVAAISHDEPNRTDSALVAVSPESVALETILELPDVDGILSDPPLDATYIKSGRTSGVTTASLRTRDTTVDVAGYFEEPDIGPATFQGIDVLGPMSKGGDSGSIIGVERDDGFYATHLLFGGSSSSTLAVPFDTLVDVHGPLDIVRPNHLPDDFD